MRTIGIMHIPWKRIAGGALRSGCCSHGPTALLGQPSYRELSLASRQSNVDIPFKKRMKDQFRQKRDLDVHNSPSGASSTNTDWELTVGVEIHALLNTNRKLFSSALSAVGTGAPNSSVALFDAAIPGSQPLFQTAALVPAIRAALALNCEIQPWSAFDRKHYFYWDQPAGYQITQYFHPLAKNGRLSIFPRDCPQIKDEVVVGIQQIQLEQDTAQTLWQPPSTNLIDLNRVSSPLIEIISSPDIHDPAVAAMFVKKVQAVLKRINANIVGMEWGGLRADVNVSVQPRQHISAQVGQPNNVAGSTLGRRTEIKNLSSFKAVEEAVRAEMSRQIRILESGGSVEGETRGWSLGSSETTRLRGKEGEVDYRYMPDPDLSPIHIDDSLVSYLRSSLPALPDELVTKYTSAPYHLSLKDARSLIDHEDERRLDLYTSCFRQMQHRLGGEHLENGIGRTVGNWVLHDYGGLVADNASLRTTGDDAHTLANIVSHVVRQEITAGVGKKVLSMILSGDLRPVRQILDEELLWTNLLTEQELQRLARTLLDDNCKMIAQMRQKQDPKKLIWFMGQMMRTAGKERVDPKAAEEVLRQLVFESTS